MMTRRTALAGMAATAALAGADERPKRKGRIKQSVAAWCFQSAGDKWSLDKLCEVTKSLGCSSVELLGPDSFKTLKKHGLVCAIASNGMPGAPFMKGVNNPRYHDEVIKRTKKAIDDCADAAFPAVIAFTGYQYVKAEDPKSGLITRDDGYKNSVKALKELALHAEKKKVTVCLEHLNTRDDSHPMK